MIDVNSENIFISREEKKLSQVELRQVRVFVEKACARIVK